jgi:hypothetical protein
MGAVGDDGRHRRRCERRHRCRATGVTVEAASPALIEKVRTVATDGDGPYKIVDLRPGTYAVTFTLPGFSTVKREGVELTTGFTATVNAEMKVGSLQETVTVSGATPVVDIQNVRTQNMISREVFDSVPTAKSTPALAALTVGVSVTTGTGNSGQDVGGNKGEQRAGLSIHGSDPNDGRFLYDGMRFNMMSVNGGGPSKHYYVDQNDVQEMVLETNGMVAETDTGGVQVNVVPKAGGNTFAGNVTLTGANDSFQASNLTDSLRARGITNTNTLKKVYDVGGGFGGAIKKDKLWFYTSHRWWASQEYAPGSFYNKTQGTPVYTPDPDRRGNTDYLAESHTLRLTWQAAAKHKVTISDKRSAQLQLQSVRRHRDARAGSRGRLHLLRDQPRAGDVELSGHEQAPVPGRGNGPAQHDRAALSARSEADRHRLHRAVEEFQLQR